jgi:hypothetical protein
MQQARLNYARRQQYRRLSRAATAAIASAVTVVLALAVANAGAVPVAGAMLALVLGLSLYARHRLSLAERSRVGARSADEVRRALAPLRADGWRVRHSLPWRGRGDIDSLAIAADRRRVRGGDENEEVRRSPYRSGARAGGMAVTPASALVSAWRGAGRVSGSLARRREG